MENKCKGITNNGEQCRLNAGKSGYCHLHDPLKQKERKEAQLAKREKSEREWAKGEKLREVIEIVQNTCKAKGWRSFTKNTDYKQWRYATVVFSRYVSFHEVEGFFDISLDGGVKISSNKVSFYSHGIRDLFDAVMANIGELPWLESKKEKIQKNPAAAFKHVAQLLQRFHIIARQLKRRYNGRETLLIKDEYDVQDLLHALLKTKFDDVRPEEYSPSYAGSSSRIDFLLKEEKIVVEVKMANSKLADKLIGEQLIIDIKRYQVHPDCKTLICFVYDPDGYIRNPVALENDLTGNHDKISVHVLVVPK
ncbi:hypothetical protein [Candidatus Leptofilum sp.]|uniref:PD-(D/E)XK nuclease domain-containing protein n=1 Tax=Candidatus Leptofilum sp. TaxID=3241576 RepID=UPI003B5A22E8